MTMPRMRTRNSDRQIRRETAEARTMIVVGVIGPIAAGKSVVMDELSRLGAVTVRADEVSREVLVPGGLLESVIDEFGEAYRREVDGLDRAKLGSLIFSDDDARKRLERIVHPAMVQRMSEKIERARQRGAPMVAVEAANLVEMGALALVDVTVMVDAPEKQRLQRLISRDDLSPEEARRRLDVHDRLGIDRHETDYEIDASGSENQTRREAQRLWNELVKP